MELKLPAGRTEAEAVKVAREWRERIWNRPARDEDERIDRLVKKTTEMCCGDAESGARLATMAIWS